LVLEDDLNFFPAYKAVFLYRMDADPRVIKALKKLEGSIDENLMMQLNAEAERTKDYSLAANMYFEKKLRTTRSRGSPGNDGKDRALDCASSIAGGDFAFFCDPDWNSFGDLGQQARIGESDHYWFFGVGADHTCVGRCWRC